MTQENLERAFYAFMRRRPFLPFFIELHSGASIRVPHPEAIVMRGQIAVFVGPDRKACLFDGLSISRLHDADV